MMARLRVGDVHLIREPVLAPGLAPLPDSGDVFGERQLLRIAGHEVGDALPRRLRVEPHEELEQAHVTGEKLVHLARNGPHFHGVSKDMSEG